MKIIYFLLMLFLFLCPIKTYAMSAESYVVMDYDSKRVLLSKAPEKEKLIASTTKIMTCLLATLCSNISGLIYDYIKRRKNASNI